MFISAEVLSYYYFRKKLFTKYIQHEILLDPKDGSRADGMGGDCEIGRGRGQERTGGENICKHRNNRRIVQDLRGVV